MARAESLPLYTRFEDVPPCYDADKVLADFNALSSDEKARLGDGIVQAASRADVLPHLKDAADAAASAADAIDAMLISLTAKLMNLDGTEAFVEQFTTIKGHYRSVVADSHELAISIAHYAESFDVVVVKFCADETLTVQRRTQKINEFIANSDAIKASADDMVARFKSLKDEFTEFVNGFSAWAKEREEADEEKVKQLLQDIRDLDEQIAAIETAMQVIGYSLGATIPATIALATLFPPAAPWILGIGCSIAGVEILSLTGLAIAKNILLNDKRQKEYEVQDLQNEIGKIKAARTQLEEKGQADLLIFTTNITAISKIWVDVHDDAQLIRTWLSEGAKAANAPEYMKAALDKGVKVYSNMAQYLKNYANGVTGTVQRLKA